MKYHALLLFLKKQQNLKLSSAANYRWSFMGYARTMPLQHPYIKMAISGSILFAKHISKQQKLLLADSNVLEFSEISSIPKSMLH